MRGGEDAGYCSQMPGRGIAQGSLVQRELSAKLTDGLLYRSIDIRTNSTEISAYFVVGNTDDSHTILLQKSGAVCIFFDVSILIVLRTVRLNDEFCFGCMTIPPSRLTPRHLPLHKGGFGAAQNRRSHRTAKGV